MPPVTVYTTRFCPYCIAAKQLLAARDIPFTNIAVDGDHAARADLRRRSGQQTVPQIWIGDFHVGGYTDLRALDLSGELQRLIASSGVNEEGRASE